MLKSSEDEIIDKRMARLNIEQDIVQAYKVEYVDVASKQEVIGSLIGGWLPYIFILFGFLGAMYPALDLGSGEKERGPSRPFSHLQQAGLILFLENF